MLTAIIFGVGTSEFMIVGLLETIAVDLAITIPTAGNLIAAFAIGIALGAPVMVAATLRFRPESVLAVLAVTFVAGQVAAAVAATYETLLLVRAVSGIAGGSFWAVAAVLAVRMAPAGTTGRVLGVLIGGITVANVIGVPLGTLIGQQWGWRASFWAVAALTATAALGLTRLPRAARSQARPGALRHELTVFRGPRLWLALGTTVTYQAALYTMFAYLAPLLTQVTGLPAAGVPAVLFLFGAGSLVGLTLGGRAADGNVFKALFGALAAMVATLATLAAVTRSTPMTIVAVVFVAVAAFAASPALNARVFQVAGAAPTLAASLHTSAFNIGSMAGAWTGAAVLTAGVGYRGTAAAGAALALIALLVAATARAYDIHVRGVEDLSPLRSSVTSPQADHRRRKIMLVPPPRAGSSAHEAASVVLISRLELRKLRDVVPFLMASLRLWWHFRSVAGGIKMRLAARPTTRTFWTWSSWTQRSAIATYVGSPGHQSVMDSFDSRMAGSTFTTVPAAHAPDRWDDVETLLKASHADSAQEAKVGE